MNDLLKRVVLRARLAKIRVHRVLLKIKLRYAEWRHDRLERKILVSEGPDEEDRT